MNVLKSLGIILLSAGLCLAVIAATRFAGQQPVQTNEGIFSLIDIISAFVVGIIVLYSLRRAQRKSRK